MTARPGSLPTRLCDIAAAFGALSALLLAPAPIAATQEAESISPVLRVQDMTFVGSRGSVSELVVRSKRATFRPHDNLALLEDVQASVTEKSQDRSFTITCDQAELNVETNDFVARGNVRGETSDGQRYSAPWVRYDHDEGLLLSDAPVQMVDETGSFRGDGFRYHVREKRFRLLGNVTVEQAP